MEEDVPSFSHPQLPSSSLLPPKSSPQPLWTHPLAHLARSRLTVMQEQILSLEPLRVKV